jgi:hypothetical protein
VICHCLQLFISYEHRLIRNIFSLCKLNLVTEPGDLALGVLPGLGPGRFAFGSDLPMAKRTAPFE